MNNPQISEPDSKAIDALWVGVFRSPLNAFYAPLACSLNFEWSSKVDTAATDGGSVLFNPEFFNKITPSQRLFVFMHEVDHVARLHHIRQGNRNPELWNIACDYEINNELSKSEDPRTKRKLYDLNGFPVLINHDYDNMSAEEIYDKLLEENPPQPMNLLGGDMESPEEVKKPSHGDILAKVVNAKTVADQATKGIPGSSPGFLDRLIETYARPAIPWQKHLTRFMTELIDSDYSWQRRNIYYQDVFIPALVPVEGLAHIVFFYDVSGSVTEEQIKRFNTEVAHIHKHFAPEKLTVITFDTELHEQYVFSNFDTLKDIKVSGGGGTSLQPVYDWLVKNKPTASIIFSDLECYGIPDPKTPILWGIIGNRQYFFPKFGTSIKIPLSED